MIFFLKKKQIGRSFLSAFTNMTGNTGAKPNINIGVSERAQRSESIWDDTLGWVLKQSKSNPFLSQQIESMLDKNLPDRIVKLIDDDDDDENTDCIKMLLCKTAPFIWSMQKAVSAQMNDSDGNELEEPPAEEEKNSSADVDNNNDDEYRLKPFSKYLPSVNEFQKHGNTCEHQFKGCKLF